MEYSLDMNAARAADNIHRSIDKSGKYLGRFTRAESVVSTKGTRGIDFSFKADDGATANYLTIWTINSEGKRLYSYNLLMAIMTVLRVKNISESVAEVEKYDREMGKVVKQSVTVFRELMDKPLGLLIYMEEYPKNNGETAWKPQIFVPFDVNEFTASEILAQAKTPEKLPRLIQALRDKPLASSASSVSSASSAPTKSDSFSDFDDDIPF